MTEEKVIILDFGGQYKELIARRVRECGVYSEILPNTVSAEEIRRQAPIGIIFTGGPQSVYEPGAPGATATFSASASRSWVSVTGCTSFAIFAGEKSPHARKVNTALWIQPLEQLPGCFLIVRAPAGCS
jgi:hypothetical protein